MQTASLHNPDRYMADLRRILSQGRERIGISIGKVYQLPDQQFANLYRSRPS